MEIDREYQTASAAAQAIRTDLALVLKTERNIDLDKILGVSNETWTPLNVPDALLQLAQNLRALSHDKEATAIDAVHDKITASPSHGGLGIDSTTIPTPTQYNEVLFQSKAWLHTIKSTSTAPNFLTTSPTKLPSRSPLNLPQKILLQHLLTTSPSPIHSLPPSTVHRIGTDWILASELSWHSMAQTHTTISSPGIWRNDRLWLAGDHVVHPSITHLPKIRTYIASAEAAKRDFLLTEYQGMNYTIMHTEFVRERAQPGQVVVGSDSHTCSAGAVGCLAVGLGTADVMMTAALGETWLRVPEVLRVEFVGRPGMGVMGKDVILGVLGALKRNTVAAERIVEFGGEGARWLSVDSRFALCNMCTEWGAITGIFVPDEVTMEYVNSRKRKMDRSGSVYFKPDLGAEYVGTHTIDLSKIEHSVAVYPEPDAVVPVSEKVGLPLDGVFIGACTTTEEEIVLAALVLQAGLRKGLPLAKGKRHYVPGSLPIVDTLRKLNLLQIYEEAGFTRGPPGCSLCVGLSAEKAQAGETWLSSQNRNFQNRMGPGSFGHLSSAAVCAASAFSMTITSPDSLLHDMDTEFWDRYKTTRRGETRTVPYAEPLPYLLAPSAPVALPHDKQTSALPTVVESRMTLLGDFIDTDALAPGESLTTCTTDAEFGAFCLKHTHPSFRATVAAGHAVVVAGNAFGVGSSRECAVSALKGAGVRCVIARSFGFIFGRNMPCLGLLGFTVDDEGFWGCVAEGKEVVVDVEKRVVRVQGEEGEFGFVLSDIEEGLLRDGGIAESYKLFGKGIWENLMDGQKKQGVVGARSKGDDRLEW